MTRNTKGCLGAGVGPRFFLPLMTMMLAFIASPVAAQTVSAEGRAIALQPLEIVKVQDLDFGTFIVGPTNGTVEISADTSSRTLTGGIIAGGSNAGNAAQFLTFGGPLQFIFVTRGPLPVLTRQGGTETINVDLLTLNGPVFRFLNAAGLLDLRVGGRLQVGANQAPGLYTGTFDITVTYF